MTGPHADRPRVVSLAPSATATLAAMGRANLLVGVTTHCPVDARAGSDEGAMDERDATAGDDETAANDDESPAVVGGWLNPDLDRVAALDPDLVCTSDALQEDVRAALDDRGVDVHHAAPATLPDVLDSFAALGAAVEAPEAGERLAADARRRLDRVRERVADRDRPVVYCEEWSDPPMAAGNWVPEVVAAAGGEHPFVAPGERSREVDRGTVEAADPDHVVLHVCGRGDRVDPGVVRDRGWALDAAVHVVDDSLLNQPSPRLLDGAERLAALLHPDAVAE